jgi:toxin-antitoxin system PIN domain toxin
MIVPDVNLLLYAVNSDAPLHQPAREWLEETLSGAEDVGLSWIVILAFLRLTTRAGVFAKPLRVDAAFETVAGWLEAPGVRVALPGPQHFGIMRSLLQPLGTGGNLTSDAHLAAIAIEHNALLCSCDHDFARFPGLRWTDPLSPTPTAATSRSRR